MCQTDFCIIQPFCSPLARCHCQSWRDKPKEMLLSPQNSHFSMQARKQSPWHSQEYTVTPQRSSSSLFAHPAGQKASLKVPAGAEAVPAPAAATALFPQGNLPQCLWKKGWFGGTAKSPFPCFRHKSMAAALPKERNQCLSQTKWKARAPVSAGNVGREQDWCPCPCPSLPVSAPPGTDPDAALLVLACELEIVKEERQVAG